MLHCVYPNCSDQNGEPRLTNEGMCRPCQDRYRRLLRWLVLDWVNLHTNMPTPPRREDGEPRTTSKVYGHPAEWASDTAAEIADTLNWIHDDTADHLNQTPPPHPGTTEAGRIRKAWKYLDPRIPTLATYPAAEDTAAALNELHHKIRSILGYTRVRQTLPTPCANCELRTLQRTLDPYDDRIICDHCGWTLRQEHYPFFTRIVLDSLIDADTEPATVA